jgi:hypothetical protein
LVIEHRVNELVLVNFELDVYGGGDEGVFREKSTEEKTEGFQSKQPIGRGMSRRHRTC